jgi:hypothetical protein
VGIPANLSRHINDRLQEAMGALDLGLLSEDTAERSRRMLQAKDALRRAAELVAANTVRQES